MRPAGFLLAAALAAVSLYAAKPLDIYFIDVEGGQATLLVSPGGQSLLVDTGWPGFNGRDAARIAAAAKKAGVKALDYVLVTHYHRDHVGGVEQLAEKLPIKTFIDHGPNNETTKDPAALYETYEKIVAKGKRLIVKPGDKIPLKGATIDVVSAAGELIREPLPGAGEANPLCAGAARKAEDKSENGQSVGFLLTLGKFRFLNLADLTWNKELELACPSSKLPPVDLYLSTHHGMNASGPAAIVHAVRPRVAVMNNGAKKGGTPEAWQVIRTSPGLEDIWQLHYALAGGRDNNSPDAMIANPDEACEGRYIKVSALDTGEFTVLNTRNKYQKTYKAR